MTKVFVSSVSKGLEETRQQIISDLHRAGFDVSAMERFGAQVAIPIEVCLREARRADVVVLIIGPRYGSVLPQGISYTHAEFREARGAGIPVLAFRVPDDPGLPASEQQQVAAFLTEVGSRTTYDSLHPGELLERLSPKVLAALTAARNRGDLANRFSLFQPYQRFFAAQLGDTSAFFNHEGPFVGRDDQLRRLVDFIKGDEPLLLLKAPGGSGKSRLLLEAAKSVAAAPGSPKVLFVDSGAQWSADDINQLPTAPTVLVFDDAHRRPDLDRLIAACRQHNDQIRCMVSCRPSAVEIVKPLLGQLLADAEPPDIDLPTLTKDVAEVLAHHYLGKGLHHLSERLVKLADRNPLVIRVGARCIADKLVLPEVLERTPEAFRTVVLDRLLDDPGLKQGDAETRRRILEVIAAIGPVPAEGDEFVSRLNSITGAPDHELRRTLAILERAGFLMRRGRLVRVSPDVLSDHLLYRAAVDESGKPTGFVEAMIKLFAPALLENILANASELDWRGAVTTSHESVLATTWRDMLGVLPQLTNAQRTQLVAQLKRAAIFAPDEVLRVAEWLADHPDAPADEQMAQWGLEDKPDRVVDAVAGTFAFIATHSDFTKRCVSRLWQLAVSDGRPTNPNPDHPRRLLQGLVKYEWRPDWQSPKSSQVQALLLLIDQLRDPTRTDDATWAIAIVGSALHRIGERHESNRRQFTIGQFSLAGSLQHISDRRRAAIDCLREVALGSRSSEGIAALHELGALLRAPRGPFGQELEEAEVAEWQPEAESAIALLKEIATSAASEVVRFMARRELREVSREHWPQIAPTVEQALIECPPVANERLYDLLVGMPRQEQLDDYQEEEKRVGEACEAAARAFWQEHDSATSVVESLLAAIAALQHASSRGEANTGRIIRSIVTSKPDESRAVIRALVDSGDQGLSLLRPALLGLYQVRPADAREVIIQLSHSKRELLRAHALDALQFMVEDASSAAEILEIARRLGEDESSIVRRVVPEVLRRFRERSPAEALKILTSIEWNGDLSLGRSVLHILDARYGLDPNALSDGDVDTLLNRIENLRSLEGYVNETLRFIAFASIRRPRQTIEMLLRRVRAVDAHSGERGENQWTPIPYNGRGLTLPGLHKSENYLDLLRLIRDAALEASPAEEFWIPELFHVATTDLQASLSVLQEWSQSGDEKKIVSAAHLLRGFEHGIVFSAHEFIAELLEAAARSGEECLEHTASKLYAAAVSGAYSGTPGQPAPRHVRDKADAQKLAELYAARGLVADFYKDLVSHAENSIKRQMQHWDEEGDDE